MILGLSCTENWESTAALEWSSGNGRGADGASSVTIVLSVKWVCKLERRPLSLGPVAGGTVRCQHVLLKSTQSVTTPYITSN